MREVELGLGLAFWRKKVKEDGKVNGGGFIEASVAVAEGGRERPGLFNDKLFACLKGILVCLFFLY